jgi:phage terminase Nu1 subunit (DNA packaging protein)
MVNEQYIVNLNRDGWVHRTASGKYRLVEVVQGFLNAKAAAAKRNTRSASEDRIRDARATEIELRNAIRARELVETSAATTLVHSMCGAVRTEFGSLPARVTRDLKLPRQIEKEVNEALNRIADRLEKESAALEEGREDTEGSEDEDADSLRAEASEVRW